VQPFFDYCAKIQQTLLTKESFSFTSLAETQIMKVFLWKKKNVILGRMVPQPPEKPLYKGKAKR
jgi:hypothetical protein